MFFFLIALLFFITNNAYLAKECRRVPRDSSNQEEPTTTISPTTISPTTISPTTLSPDNEDLEELIKSRTAESAAILLAKLSKNKEGSSKPFNVEVSSKIGSNKAYACSRLDCPAEDKITPVCACNFITGNVASFKNKCDSLKHNCRFDTNFKVILDEICPWEFAFRRNGKEYEFDYHDPKYYN